MTVSISEDPITVDDIGGGQHSRDPIVITDTNDDEEETEEDNDDDEEREQPDDDDDLIICVLQVPLRQKDESPLDALRSIMQWMRTNRDATKIDLFVLPELAPLGYSQDTFKDFLPHSKHLSMYRKIDHMFAHFARAIETYICYGSVGITANNRQTIRQIVVNPRGERIAVYDKMHLCDYGDCRETNYFTGGDKVCSFRIRDYTLGIVVCADMRCAALSQTLTKQCGVDVILQPSAFCRDVSFRTWNAFRETRAVENGVYWVAVNYAGSYYGNSAIVPPWVDDDHEPMTLGCEPGVLVGRISRNVLRRARTEMPFYNHVVEGCKSCSCLSRDDDTPKKQQKEEARTITRRLNARVRFG